jgi:transposase-like protein
MAGVLVKYPPCSSQLIYRHDKYFSGLQRYYYQDCYYCFQLDYPLQSEQA